MRRCPSILAIAATLALPRIAAAQSTDRVIAEALFREGRELMEANRLAEACPKFADSQKLDPALGTLINLALCHEKEGKTASAWAEFQEAAAEAAAERDDREAFARKHVAALEADLPRLQLVVDATMQTLPNLEIRIDGTALGRATWTTALPVDPGKHQLAASADGKQPWTKWIDVPKGTGTTNVNVPTLEDVPVTPAPPPPPPPLPPPPVTRRDERGNTQRLVGYVVGGAGLVGLGVGGAFGISALSFKQSRDGHCTGNNLCDRTGVHEDTNARHAATASTVAFIAGGALLAGGVVLVLTAPKNRAVTVGVGPGALTVGGAF